MSTSERNAYHHGDLKAALLRAAMASLEQGGAAAVSLREAARQAGVSPTAAYRHFADKDAMLAALAAQGFDAFTDAMQAAAEAVQRAAGAAGEPFAEMGVAYVRFAVAHPGMFRLMFGPAVADRSRSPELVASLARSTRLFEQGMAARTDITGDPRVEAVRAWALVHGLAMLVLDGMLPGLDAEGLARAVLGSPAPGTGGAEPQAAAQPARRARAGARRA
ncbi:TetR/AcrR family transcriptional regulator [Ideonella sp. DXS22W]|uniref:TetR/AcrR family transcriptional regulator n=1 Tax=Pseudaquabacterium inlustre TaxID=2984192 RepID=A0ABU9CLU4_9BURK